MTTLLFGRSSASATAALAAANLGVDLPDQVRLIGGAVGFWCRRQRALLQEEPSQYQTCR